MPAVTGILESSLYVKDLERSRQFYQHIFGFKVLVGNERMYGLDVASRQVLLLFLRGASNQPNLVPGGIAPPHDGSGQLHLTFSIAADQLDAWMKRLATAGVAIESTVHSPRGGTSL